ncbi:MAG: DUF362 domain-containing protein [Candidatus Magnetomorum sp.]|nr:DUF362 domain-containing protein [Candidatus Magnetomorum sp.]
MEKVSLIACSSYDDPDLKDKILKSLIDIDFDLQLFKGMRVGIKPNLLIPTDPERAIITHPVFFQNVVQIIKEHEGIPVLVENPAVHGLSTVLKKTPYGEIVQALNVGVPDMAPTQLVPYDDAHQFKRIEISKAFFDVDMIINLPKLKTHGLTVLTGALKNLFGVIPGLKKSRMHLKAPSRDDFSNFMMDLYGALLYGFDPPKPLLHIMDGIIGMEGEGPGLSGTPVPIGVIISSRDPLAVDWTATQVLNVPWEDIPTLTAGFQRPYCISSPDDIHIIGEAIDNVRLSSFNVSKNSIFSNAVRWPFTSNLFKQLFVEKPVPNPEKCTLCYQCMRICPAKAISPAEKREKIPVYDYNQCIRCFCCMEICPEAAIKTEKGWLQWLFRY